MHEAHFKTGIDLFNAGRYFEAHEAWEILWLPATGEDRIFLQGLIQLAAAYLQRERGNVRGATRLFEAAISKLDSVASHDFGVNLPQLLVRARADAALMAKQLHGVPPRPTQSEDRPWISLTLFGRAR